MMNNKTFYFFGVCVVTLLFGCARTGVLTGGARDETPPMWILEKSTPINQTNIRPKSFDLVFDEFVKVEDVVNQLVVSPPLVYNPRVESRGKTIRFTFNEKEELRDSTTYTINFGESIRDFNENNKATGVRFVFSTGPIIDSLVLTGRILDAITGDPIEKATALLYNSTSDSAVIKERPYYFGRTDKSGSFSIENMKAGTYQVVGLKEDNPNYRYDDGKEMIGYIDSLIKVDTSNNPIELRLFNERQKNIIEKIDSTTKGMLLVQFKDKIEFPKVILSDSTIQYLVQHLDKELRIWHQSDTRIRHWIKINQGEHQVDSIRIWSYPLRAEMARQPLECTNMSAALPSGHPDSTFHLQWNIPLLRIEGDGYKVIKEKEEISFREIKKSDRSRTFPNVLLTFEPMRASGKFNIRFEPGDLIDIYGRGNDSILFCSLELYEKESFTNLTLTLEGLSKDKKYVARLMYKDKVKQEWKINETDSWTGVFLQLRPENHQLWLLEDDNDNGRWDPGSFFDRKQPERKRTLEIAGLRANWDIDQAISVADWYQVPTVVGEDEEKEEDVEREENEEGENKN